MTVIIKQRAAKNAALDLSEVHPVLQKIYQNRDVNDASELDYALKNLLPYHELKGIEAAVNCLKDAVTQQKRLLIIGDFDADGATSTALAVSCLRNFGVDQVEYLVPNRFTYGYGLTPEIVEVATRWKPDVIITVDNGISSVDGVACANAAGIDVVITDHHLAGDVLPQATAIVNPNQPGCQFKSKNLAGVGVIFYVMSALRRELINSGWFNESSRLQPNMAAVLDIVALGTVADVVPLDFNNRILVQQGLKRIQAGHACPGILALLKVAKRNYKRITSQDLGFAIGPRLNAAGRLDDMSLGIECLLAPTQEVAEEKAQILDELNHERRSIEQEMQEQAFGFIERLSLKQDQSLPRGLCLYDENWHQGVIGILAGRIKERLHRPVIAFAKVSDDEVKGSARSVPGVHIRDVLDAIAKSSPDLIAKFGGHAMAAGLSLKLSKLEAFSKAFAAQIEKQLSHDDLQGVIWSDGQLSENDFTLDLAQMLRNAGPWGQQFPEPQFDGEFSIINQRALGGGKHLKLTLQPKGSDQFIDAIAFNISQEWPNYRAESLTAAFRLDVNEYNDRVNLQLMIEHMTAK